MRTRSRATDSSVMGPSPAGSSVTVPPLAAAPGPAVRGCCIQNTRMSLAELLVEHPFSDDEDLLHSIDRSLTAGQTRREAATLASQLRAAGVGAGHPGAGELRLGGRAV